MRRAGVVGAVRAYPWRDRRNGRAGLRTRIRRTGDGGHAVRLLGHTGLLIEDLLDVCEAVRVGLRMGHTSCRRGGRGGRRGGRRRAGGINARGLSKPGRGVVQVHCRLDASPRATRGAWGVCVGRRGRRKRKRNGGRARSCWRRETACEDDCRRELERREGLSQASLLIGIYRLDRFPRAVLFLYPTSRSPLPFSPPVP